MKKLCVIFLLLTMFSFKVADFRSIYNLPMQADAVCASDIDLDGDLDIIVKHSINMQTKWGGIYMLQNDGFGHFTYLDSIYDTAGIWTVYTDKVISKTFPDIIYHPNDNITILNKDGDNYNKFQFYIGTHINDFALGDVDGNGNLDVVFISSQNHFWGIIYNQSDSSFTSPVYYETDNPPNDIACKDLNDDGREDIVVGGASFKSEIWFGLEDGLEKYQLPYGATNISIDDFDNDGDNDIITFSDAYIISFVHLYENLGNNVFDTVNDFNVPEGCSDFFVTDFNNDSLPDALFLTYGLSDVGCIIYYNQGNFQMGDTQNINLINYGEARRFMYCADMDGNGFNDIIITRQVFDTAYAPSYLEVLFNDGNGNFGENPLTVVESINREPDVLSLTCYPNPFNDKTNIEYTIAKESLTDLSIYNMNGQKIKTFENITLGKGKYKTTWDGTDNKGKEISSGIYLVILKIDGTYRQTIKLLKQY